MYRSRLTFDEAPLVDIPLTALDISLLPKNMQTEKALHSLRVFKYNNFSGQKEITRGGVLMLHKSPHMVIPEAYTIISISGDDFSLLWTFRL